MKRCELCRRWTGLMTYGDGIHRHAWLQDCIRELGEGKADRGRVIGRLRTHEREPFTIEPDEAETARRA